MLSSALTFTLALISLSSRVQVSAAPDLTAANNITGLLGTWASNTAVSTGMGTSGAFCNPAEMEFTYPNNTGISYSFTDTGFFEEAQYRYTSNASNPSCITAYILWQHGTYTLENDGSMVLTPFGSDGRIQVQDPCAATTNVITYYDQVTTYSDWGITIDNDSGNYALKLNRFDGAKMPPMYLSALPPNMLPTQYLTGTNASGQTNSRKRSFTSQLDIFKRSAASPRAGSIGGSLGGGAVLASLVGTAAVALMALI